MVRDRSPGGHSLPSVPSAGREGRDERDALGPAAAVEDAGTAGTWLPGRRALSFHTHTSFPVGAAVRRPGLGPGLSLTSSWIRQTHSHVVHASARAASVGFGCQTGVRSPGAASHSLQAEKCLVT